MQRSYYTFAYWLCILNICILFLILFLPPGPVLFILYIMNVLTAVAVVVASILQLILTKVPAPRAQRTPLLLLYGMVILSFHAYIVLRGQNHADHL